MPQRILKLKKPAKQLAYRKRYLALTSHDQVKLRKLRNAIASILVRREIEGKLSEECEQVLQALAFYYLQTVTVSSEDIEYLPSLNRGIDSFTASQCRINFRFLKDDLRRVARLLGFSAMVSLSNGMRMRGEEVFLRGLYELVSGEVQEKASANVFGADQPTQSRSCSFFIDHIYDTFHHLVHDSLDWWHRNGFFAKSADAIGEKMGIADNLVAHFIDCNCLPTSVVGGGPAEDGANAMRWDEAIQRAFYNGWKSIHGLKHQTVDNAYGMTVDMKGPDSLREHDLTVFWESNINARMAACQDGERDQYITMGDSAYVEDTHITSYKDASANPYFKTWNLAMKRVRISIEWNYGHTASLFKYVQRRDKLQVLRSCRVAKVYTVATILRNLHCALYGCQTSNYFGLELPEDFIEHYIYQTDL